MQGFKTNKDPNLLASTSNLFKQVISQVKLSNNNRLATNAKDVKVTQSILIINKP
jgi:hypothetical protein